MRPLYALAFAVGLLPLLGPSGCDGPGDLACTEIGCSDGYTVAVLADGRFADGLYTLDVTAGGETERCQFEIAAGRIGAETCNAVYAVGASYPAPEAVAVSRPPVATEVGIVVARDGAVLRDLTTTPAYGTVQPNGPDCPPTCRVARTEVHLGEAGAPAR